MLRGLIHPTSIETDYLFRYITLMIWGMITPECTLSRGVRRICHSPFYTEFRFENQRLGVKNIYGHMRRLRLEEPGKRRHTKGKKKKIPNIIRILCISKTILDINLT